MQISDHHCLNLRPPSLCRTNSAISKQEIQQYRYYEEVGTDYGDQGDGVMLRGTGSDCGIKSERQGFPSVLLKDIGDSRRQK